MPGRDGARGQEADVGQATIMIIGFAVVLAMAVALVTDVSAAYLRRSGLDTLADGAALRGADLGATGQETYLHGVPADRLALTAATVRSSVQAYLVDVGAFRRYPGLTWTVRVDGAADSVTVRVRAPLELPLTIPGSPQRASIGATGSAVVATDAGPGGSPSAGRPSRPRDSGAATGTGPHLRPLVEEGQAGPAALPDLGEAPPRAWRRRAPQV